MIAQPLGTTPAVEAPAILREAAVALEDGLVLLLPVVLLDEFPGVSRLGRCWELGCELRRLMGIDLGPGPHVRRLPVLRMLMVWHPGRYYDRFTGAAESPDDLALEVQLHGPASVSGRRFTSEAFPLPGTHLTVLRCPDGMSL